MNSIGVILRNVLALDGLYHFLNQGERCQCHLAIRNKEKSLNSLSAKVQKAAQIVQRTNYDAPEFRYMPDRILYFWDEEQEQWQKSTDYKPAIRLTIYRELKQPK